MPFRLQAAMGCGCQKSIGAVHPILPVRPTPKTSKCCSSNWAVPCTTRTQTTPRRTSIYLSALFVFGLAYGEAWDFASARARTAKLWQLSHDGSNRWIKLTRFLRLGPFWQTRCSNLNQWQWHTLPQRSLAAHLQRKSGFSSAFAFKLWSFLFDPISVSFQSFGTC